MKEFTIYSARCCQNEKNTEYPIIHKVTSVEEFRSAVRTDNVGVKFKGNKRSIDNFISANVVQEDLDNDHTDDSDGWQNIDALQDAFPDVEMWIYPSRNHMKQKRKANGVIKEAREKYHIDLPLSRAMGGDEYQVLKGRIGALFPYFDQRVLDIPHFMYGVNDENLEVIHIDGSLTIDQYIDQLEADGFLQAEMIASVSDYHKHSDWEKISKWDEEAGYQSKNEIDVPADDTGDEYSLIFSARNVEQFLTKHNIVYEKSMLKGSIYKIAYYVECPWKENHTCDGGKNQTAILINKIGAIMFLCHHDHCADKKWIDYKAFYEKQDSGSDGAKPKKDGASKKFDIKLVQGKKLQQQKLPPIHYAVDGMIPEGYSVFSAPFKMGKSWMALECCLAIAKGSDFLGMHTTKGSAVYFALEDCDKFAQERLNMALDYKDAPEGFYYVYEKVPTIDEGLIDYLDQMKGQLPDLRLVVVDVLAKVECQPQRGETAYHCDYRTGTALKEWADNNQVSVVSITHTTKHVHVEDVFMNTTGTNGVTGSADAILTISKDKRSDKTGVLAIIGRRVREKYLKVHLCDGYLWESEGETDPDQMDADRDRAEQLEHEKKYMESPIRQAVITLAKFGENTGLHATDVIQQAREHEIYITDTAKAVGGFLHTFQNMFTVKDAVKVTIASHGKNGSKTYSFEYWDNDTEDNEKE